MNVSTTNILPAQEASPADATHTKPTTYDQTRLVDPTKAKTEGPKVATGLQLAGVLDLAKFSVGTTWTGKREEWRSLDTRIIEYDPPTAVVRACVTGSMTPLIYISTGLQVPDQVVLSVDSAVNMRYFKGKGWLVASIDWYDKVFGESTCALGR
jgi:hypothetical protein